MNRRRLLRIPPTEIGHAPRRGLIRIVGRVVEGGGLRAPISGVACAAFVTELFEHHGGPRLVVRVVSHEPLVIDDPTGRALVAAWRREMTLAGTTFSGHYDDARPAIEALLRDHDISPISETGSVRGISYREQVLRAGDDVTAVGYARQVVSRSCRVRMDTGYRELPTQLELGSHLSSEVLVSSDPRDTGARLGR